MASTASVLGLIRIVRTSDVILKASFYFKDFATKVTGELRCRFWNADMLSEGGKKKFKLVF